MKPERDYYEVLGVSRDADAKTIKRAFLRLAREVHPDVNDAPDAEARFKEINEAYSVLSDDQRRVNYDRFGDADGPAGFGGAGGSYVDISDIFGGFGMDDLFSSFFGGGSVRGRAQRTRGRDMGITLHISLEEAAAGCTKTIRYDRLAPCDDCGGTGAETGGSVAVCEHCGGTGRVVSVQRTILGQMQTQSTCPVCAGSGQVIDKPCETCQGQGRTPSREKTEIEIPAGVATGQQMLVRGMGEAGVRGDAAGDLVVTIAVDEHERFVRRGDDLLCELELDAFDVMLGCTREFAGILPTDTIVFSISAGTQHGASITVSGMGMPHLRGSGRGDVIGVVSVVVPQSLEADEFEELSKLAAHYRARTASAAGASFVATQAAGGTDTADSADAAGAEPADSSGVKSAEDTARKHKKRPHKKGR